MLKKILAALALSAAFTLAVNAAEVPDIELNNGVKIPQLGLGTYKLAEGEGESETFKAVLTALNAGYRHIDTAHAYGNERSVGRAIKASGIPRDEIWVTSKIWPTEYGEGKTAQAIDNMLKRLGLDYVDLVYVHQPVGDVMGAWKDLEQAYKAGKIKALGISNFDKDEKVFDEFFKTAEVRPQIMQLECHPYAQREYWQKRIKDSNMRQENWYPLGGRQSNGLILKDKTINEIAKAHQKSAAQIILRWHVQSGFIVIPGASNPDYIKENIEVFDWSLTAEEMDQIHKLNTEKRIFDPPYEEAKKQYLQTVLPD